MKRNKKVNPSHDWIIGWAMNRHGQWVPVFASDTGFCHLDRLPEVKKG